MSGKRACNGHSMYTDSKILDVTKNSTNIQYKVSTENFVPGFMVSYRHAKLSLAAPKAQKDSLIVGTSKNARTLKSIRVSGNDKQLAD